MNLKEIKKLSKMLDKEKIPHEDMPIFDGLQVNYPNKEKCVCDAICHSYSFGHEEGLLEIMGLVDKDYADDVEGYLTAKEVFDRIKKHWQQQHIVLKKKNYKIID